MSNSVIESETHNGVKSDSTKKIGEIKHEEHDHDHMHGVGVFFFEWLLSSAPNLELELLACLMLSMMLDIQHLFDMSSSTFS